MPGTYGPFYVDAAVSQQIIDAETAAANGYLDDLKQSEVLRGIPVECAAEVGAPGSLILEQAAAQQVELIVICSHGRTGPGRWALGSMAERVLHATKLPVVMVRPRHTEDETTTEKDAAPPDNSSAPPTTFSALF